jgi:hypothetical protein
MPFGDKYQNYINIFNEICNMLITYTYMFFKHSHEPNDSIGLVFIGLYVMNFCVNILKVLYVAILTKFPKLLDKFLKMTDE